MGVRTRRNQIIIALGCTSIVASKPKPRGLVEHVISLEGQPDRITGPVVAAARGLRVDLVLSDGDGQERRVPRGKRYALGDVSLQPVGTRLAGHLHVLGRTPTKALRRMRLRVISAKKRSTILSQDAEVGVKWRWKRGCDLSQRFTAGVLWVA